MKKTSRESLLCLAAVFGGILVPGSYAQDEPQIQHEGLSVHFEALGGELSGRVSGTGTRAGGRFQGEVDGTKLSVTFRLWPREEFRIDTPDDVLRIDNYNRGLRKEALIGDQAFLERRDEPYGYASFAVRASRETEVEREDALYGLLEDCGYQLSVTTQPPADAAMQKRIAKWFETGVQYEGPEIDTQWSDEEATRRWEEFTDEDLHEDLRIQRTKHYLVLSNAGGSLFAKKMEEFYDDIQKVYPFEEVRGRRLMPVFVFRTKDQYVKYYSRVAEIPESEAERSKGHAWRDYYATYYESPNDPVHIHEATHQVFFNRLGLHGGGSWFQEGVAEYMSANGNEVRSVVRGRIKSDDATPFRSLMVVPSLLQSLRGGSIRGGSAAGNAYTEAASIIAFVRESRFGKSKFQEFIHAVGQAPDSDLDAIDAALQEVYQVGIDQFEDEWKRYWAR